MASQLVDLKKKLVGGVMTQRNRSEKTAPLVCAEDVHLQLFVVLQLVCGLFD